MEYKEKTESGFEKLVLQGIFHYSADNTHRKQRGS